MLDLISRAVSRFNSQDVLIGADNEVVDEGELRDEDDDGTTLLYDRNLDKGLIAKIHREEDGDGEFYLTVDTHDSGTSCTLKVDFICITWDLCRS